MWCAEYSASNNPLLEYVQRIQSWRPNVTISSPWPQTGFVASVLIHRLIAAVAFGRPLALSSPAATHFDYFFKERRERERETIDQSNNVMCRNSVMLNA